MIFPWLFVLNLLQDGYMCWVVSLSVWSTPYWRPHQFFFDSVTSTYSWSLFCRKMDFSSDRLKSFEDYSLVYTTSPAILARQGPYFCKKDSNAKHITGARGRLPWLLFLWERWRRQALDFVNSRSPKENEKFKCRIRQSSPQIGTTSSNLFSVAARLIRFQYCKWFYPYIQ